jgi:translation initiation factor 3 subunit D
MCSHTPPSSNIICPDYFVTYRHNLHFYQISFSDLLTVSETAAEPPQDETNSLNSPRNLALEATFINHNFSQQVLKGGDDKFKFEDENPFANEDDEEEGQIASVGYRYRKWDLGNDVKLVARCEHDAVAAGPNNERLFLNIKALNEWDSKVRINL